MKRHDKVGRARTMAPAARPPSRIASHQRPHRRGGSPNTPPQPGHSQAVTGNSLVKTAALAGIVARPGLLPSPRRQRPQPRRRCFPSTSLRRVDQRGGGGGVGVTALWRSNRRRTAARTSATGLTAALAQGRIRGGRAAPHGVAFRSAARPQVRAASPRQLVSSFTPLQHLAPLRRRLRPGRCPLAYRRRVLAGGGGDGASGSPPRRPIRP